MIARDKLQHIAAGCATVAAAYLGSVVLHQHGLGWFLAYASTGVGVGYEIVQRIRREGQPDPLDAAATALPGWAALAAMQFF